MKLFKNKLAVIIVLLSVIFLGSIIFTISSENTNIISNGAGSAISPLQKIVYNVNSGVKRFVDICLNFSTVKAENKALKKENEELQEKLTEYNSVIEENKRLSESLNFVKDNDKYDYLGCSIIGLAGAGFEEGYIIDKGTKDGVKKDMILISSGVLVGKVTKAGVNYAVVQSLVNKDIAVSVTIERTRESRGILQGYTTRNNEYLTKIINLPIDSDIQEGDVILTSGLGMIYPKDIRVGEVLSVETDDVRVMKTAIVKPYADFGKLEELIVVVPRDTEIVEYR